MKKPLLKASADGKSSELIIEGVIASDSWWGDEYTPDMVRDDLAKQAGGNPITVIINSPGGEVFAGAAIYNALREYSGEVTVRIDGIAASMASVIAMVGDKIVMSPGATMMVHRPLVMAWGNIKELNKAIDMLTAIEDTILPIYEKRTGLSRDEVFNLLDEETWMSTDKAIELGFADAALEEDETKPANAFEKIKAMLDNKDFAFSMKSDHESLKAFVAKAEADKDSEEEEIPPVDPPVPIPPVPSPEKGDELEKEEEEEPETPPVTPDNKPNDKKETTEMVKTAKQLEAEKAAAEMAIDPTLAPEPDTAPKQEKITKMEARKLIVQAIAAKHAKDEEAFAILDEKLKTSMVIDGSSNSNGQILYGQEVLANDIRERYERVSRVGGLVNRIDIEGAETYAQLIETAGTGFQEVALGGVKGQDQPTWTKQTSTPHEWAVIVAWLDGVQKRSPIAVYNRIVRYIAKMYAKLESKIVLSYEGGTFDGEVRPPTGLVPLLRAADRVREVASYDSVDLMPAMGLAYGDIESDDTLVLVANRRTWGQLAVSLDNEGNTVFVRVGEKIAAGALGEFALVQDSEMQDGEVLVGVLEDYDLVTRGTLGYLLSREATIGEGESTLNLFTQDATALRADIDITGQVVFLESFQLLDIANNS